MPSVTKIPNDGMQVIKGLDPKLRDAIVNGVLFMTQDPGGKAVLKSLYNYDFLVAVDADFYARIPGRAREGRRRSGRARRSSRNIEAWWCLQRHQAFLLSGHPEESDPRTTAHLPQDE